MRTDRESIASRMKCMEHSLYISPWALYTNKDVGLGYLGKPRCGAAGLPSPDLSAQRGF